MDALTLLTPLIERRRQIILGSILLAALTAGAVAMMPRKYRAELSLTPVVNNKSGTALGGFAAMGRYSRRSDAKAHGKRVAQILERSSICKWKCNDRYPVE